MLLALDVGNSNIKSGLFDGRELVASWRIATSVDRSSDEYGMLLVQFLAHLHFAPSDISGVIVSSVSPGLNYTIDRMLRTYLWKAPLFVTSTLKTGLTIAYKPPQSLGADRIANAVAAYNIYGGPCITVDFGTATTFGVVTREGTFLGGAIAPGIRSATDALVSRAAQLQRFDFVKPDRAVADNTVGAMQAGVMYGFSGLADHIIYRIKQEIGDARVIATGGMSDVIAGDSQSIEIVDKLLTLKGLQLIHEMNA
jgi:type III pantothenate kinase